MKLLHNTKIEFQRGRILSAEMLELLQKKILQNWKTLDNAPDGIISGFLLEMRENTLFLTKGLVKLGSSVYELSQDIAIDSLPKNFRSNDCLLVITQAPPEKTGNSIITESAELQLIEQNSKLPVPHIVIGSFYFQKGEKLKLHSLIASDPKIHLENMLSPANGFFSFTYYNYLINSNVTFHPLVFTWIRQSLENKLNKTTMEYTLLMMLYQSPVLAVDVLKTYVRRYADSSTPQNSDGAELLSHVIRTIETAQESFAIAEPAKPPETPEEDCRIIF